MPDAISNTSPLLYLHRAGILDWLCEIFERIWVPSAVVREIDTGGVGGHDVPKLRECRWLTVTDPAWTPSSWLALDLGPGELAAMALALENPARVLLLDDHLARRTARAAGLQVWGTLRVLLAGKAQGLAGQIAPIVDRLSAEGMWISADLRARVLALAGE
jgi:predicted nucleic acid-binding protein